MKIPFSKTRFFATACGGALLAIAAPVVAQPAGVTVTAAADYIIGAGDTVKVSVPDQQDYVVQAQVPSDGIVELPLIGPIMANGKTLVQMRNEIRTKLSQGGFFNDPAVNVSIVESNSQHATILGEVGSPGNVTLDRQYRLSEVLAKAGGRKDTATPTVTLTRTNGQKFTLDIETIATGTGDQDPMVQAGDKIYVGRVDNFFISGQVQSPGQYPIKEGMTLRMAIAIGGGLTALGTDKKVTVCHAADPQAAAMPSAQKCTKRFPLDRQIQPDDVIKVGERFF